MNKMNQNNHEFMLKEILIPETVRAEVQVDTWQQAADAVGQLLVDSGKVEGRYVEKMKQNIEEIGPYIVVSPGVALFHSRPDDGVLEPCVGLISLAEPVDFGHPDNDPVDIVIAFGATNKESHIPALQQLAGQLGKSEIINSVRSATSDAALLDAFLCFSEDCLSSD